MFCLVFVRGKQHSLDSINFISIHTFVSEKTQIQTSDSPFPSPTRTQTNKKSPTLTHPTSIARTQRAHPATCFEEHLFRNDQALRCGKMHACIIQGHIVFCPALRRKPNELEAMLLRTSNLASAINLLAVVVSVGIAVSLFPFIQDNFNGPYFFPQAYTKKPQSAMQQPYTRRSYTYLVMPHLRASKRRDITHSHGFR